MSVQHHVTALCILLVGASQAAADGIAIDHEAVGCVIAGRFPQLFARFDPEDAVARARIAFRPAGGSAWYSVPMKKDGDSFMGVLPQPRKSLEAFDYYITVADTGSRESRTSEFSTEVVSGPAGCQGDKVLASALIDGKSILVDPPLGIANPARVPLGFSDHGVLAGAAGGAAAGAAGAAGAGATAAGAATAAGGHTGIILAAVGGAAAIGGGVAIASGGGSSPSGPSSPFVGTWNSRDDSPFIGYPFVKRLIITQGGATLAVHWISICCSGSCECDNGTQTSSVADAADGTLDLTYTLPISITTMQVMMTSATTLRCESHVHFTAPPEGSTTLIPDYDRTDLLAKAP